MKIEWSEPQPPNIEGCRYDHVTATLPFGDFSIEWKGWKQRDLHTCYFNGDYISEGSDLEDAKAVCLKFYTDKLAEHHRTECTECGEPYGLQRPLTVWYGKMPESNGKSNWTAILYRKGGEGAFMRHLSEGITIDRSEYPDRVRYEADRFRFLIGELTVEPDITAYDEKLHSGYVKPTPDIPQQTVQQLRDSGHLVVIWTPEEIGTANESHLEDLVVQRGNEYLEDFQEDDDEPSNP